MFEAIEISLYKLGIILFFMMSSNFVTALFNTFLYLTRRFELVSVPVNFLAIRVYFTAV